MPNSSAEAFEDGVDLQIGLLQAHVPQDQTSWTGYPFPRLQVSKEQEMRTFRTIILENPFLRATVLPGMGGRIASLHDKRTNTELLRRHPLLEPQAGGRRGAFVREGIQIVLDGEERLNAMGNMACQIEHATEESEDAAVWLAETHTGCGLSFHARISMPHDRAELRIEVRVLNRWLRPQSYDAGLRFYLGEGELEGRAFYSRSRKAGVALFSEQVFDGARVDGEFLEYTRFGTPREIAPRQVDNWVVRILPISGLPCVGGASSEAAASIDEGVLRVQVSEQKLGHKLLLLTVDGKTLEAPVDLYPENILEIPLGDLRPVEVALRSPAKKDILRFSALGAATPGSSLHAVEGARLTFAMSNDDLLRASFEAGSRHVAHTMLGIKALREKRFAAAGGAFEQALNYNADDHLLWWGKAMAARLGEEDNEAELLNAHYLAPLEPALRAESYLSQPLNLDPEPSRLLAPLAENPEEFIEVACLLIEAGLFDQASRWIDEALRHREMAMLRYLMAYCLLTATKLNAEASEQIRLAVQSSLAPPFPYRDVERDAITLLASTFPEDPHLRVLNGWVGERSNGVPE